MNRNSLFPIFNWKKNKSLGDLDLKYDFIISTGRTGTKFFEAFINSNFKQSKSWHEPEPDLFDVSVKYHRYSMKEIQANQAIRNARKNLIASAKKNGANHIIESNPFVSFLLPILKKTNPNSKFIHIVRHPHDYIRSAIQKDPNNSGNFFMTDSDHRSRLNSDDFPNDEFYGEWTNLNQFERICWNWLFTNKFIESQLAGYENYKMFKFEELFVEKRKDSWHQLLDFLELGKADKLVDDDFLANQLQSKRNSTEKRVDLDFEEVMEKNKTFYRKLISPEILNHYGYSN